MSERPAAEYMAALDGIRAVAVLTVVAFHAHALDAGWLGVEVFFVLSGYLITTLIVAEVERTGTVAMGAFWGRRVRRLWPAICAYLLITLTLVVPRWIAVMPPTIEHLFATLTWHENWRMIADGGYSASTHAGVVRHFWSLSIEEQFYFVWPVLVWLTARWRGARGVRIAAIVGAAASLAIGVWGIRNGWSADRLYLGSDTRVLGLFIGAALAGVRPTGRLAASTAGAGVVAIIASCYWFGDIRDDILAGPLQAFTALSAITIVCAAGLQRGPLLWAPMRAIGRWSFGIYLWHVPIGMIVHDRISSPWWEAIWTSVIATLVAAASYRLIEMPVRRRQVMGRPIALALTAAAIVCAVVGVIEVQPSESNADASNASASQVDLPPDARHVVIVGDSVPFRAAAELVADANSQQFRLTIAAKEACIMSADVGDQLILECSTWIESLPASVADADVVVVWWGGTGASVRWHGEGYEYCREPQIVPEMYGTMIDHLGSPNPSIVVVLPSARTDQGEAGRLGATCQREQIIDWAATNGIHIFDPDPARLAAGSEREVRTDGLHYTSKGAAAVSAALFDSIAALEE